MRLERIALAAAASWLLALPACNSVTESVLEPDGDGSETGQGGATTSASGSDDTGSVTSGSGSAGSGSTGSGNPASNGCSATPPPGAEVPPPFKAYSGGTCPLLEPGFNTINSQGSDRQFMLVVPEDYDGQESLPVVFLWHWLGGDATSFFDKGAAQEAVNNYRFAAVIPEAKGDVQFKWPVEIIQSDSRIEQEFVFFDDMLSCVAEQYTVNANCVSSVGVSAGALFTSLLAGGRGEYLSSILSLSGGVGGFIKNWTSSPHQMPAMVLWGGQADNCFGLMDFEATSHNLEAGLQDDGHFFIECVHNCGHSEPPMEVPEALTKFTSLWEFMLDHPYWLEPGDSPYLDGGIPPSIPEWCGIGAGSAVQRTGECTEESGC